MEAENNDGLDVLERVVRERLEALLQRCNEGNKLIAEVNFRLQGLYQQADQAANLVTYARETIVQEKQEALRVIEDSYADARALQAETTWMHRHHGLTKELKQVLAQFRALYGVRRLRPAK